MTLTFCADVPRQRRLQTSFSQRRGTIAVFSAILMAIMFGCVALAVDLGYLYLVRTELQRSADSAALAGAASLYSPSESVQMNAFYLEPNIEGAWGAAQTYAAYNGGGPYEGNQVSIEGDVLSADVVTGRYHDPSIRSEPLIPTTVSPNTVQVNLQLDDESANRSVSLYFARALGIEKADVQASAAATLIHASLLPFATSTEKWDSLLDGGDGDNFTFDHGVTAGQGDGVPEITIFPDVKWDGQELPPGNFGALSIGTDTASAADLRRQIDQGPTPGELAYHGTLTSGVVMSGKTGLNATVKVAFNGGWDTSDLRYYGGIIGHPRFLPVYDHVAGNGTNSQFRITKFVAVRVVDVNLKGKNKWITLQPIQTTNNLMAVRLTR